MTKWECAAPRHAGMQSLGLHGLQAEAAVETLVSKALHLEGGIVVGAPHDSHDQVEGGQRQGHTHGAGHEEDSAQAEHALPADGPYAEQERQPEAYELQMGRGKRYKALPIHGHQSPQCW